MSLLDTLVRDIARQLAVLNDHDRRVDRRGMAGFVPSDQLDERARNIAMALSQNYRIESLDVDTFESTGTSVPDTADVSQGGVRFPVADRVLVRRDGGSSPLMGLGKTIGPGGPPVNVAAESAAGVFDRDEPTEPCRVAVRREMTP